MQTRYTCIPVLKYLLCWCKSTNTDAAETRGSRAWCRLKQPHAKYERTMQTRYSVRLLYWYKRTNTDAAHRRAWYRLKQPHAKYQRTMQTRYSVCLLYWYKRTNTDASHRRAWYRLKQPHAKYQRTMQAFVERVTMGEYVCDLVRRAPYSSIHKVFFFNGPAASVFVLLYPSKA